MLDAVWDRRWRWVLVAVGLAVGGFLVAGVARADPQGLFGANTAAWAQAVGTIAAVVFTTRLAVRGPERQRERAIQDAREAALSQAFDMVKWVLVCESAFDRPEFYGRLRAQGFPQIQMRLAAAGLEAVPLSAFGSMEAASLVSTLRHLAVLLAEHFAVAPQPGMEADRALIRAHRERVLQLFEQLAALTDRASRLDRAALLKAVDQEFVRMDQAA